MAYVYRGTKRDLELVPDLPRTGSEPQPAAPPKNRCGTNAGYKWHQRHSEPFCGPCRAAHADYMRTWHHANKKPMSERAVGVYDPAVCGTHNGYERHRRAHTTPCEQCRAGHTEYTARRREAVRLAA